MTIERDGRIVAAVPQCLPEADIARLLHSRQPWIYATLDRKRLTETAPPPKAYVSGEGFYYLGRKYRLKLLAGEPVPTGLQLCQGEFRLPQVQAPQGRACFIDWYTAQARVWIAARLDRLKTRVAAAPQTLTVRDLGYRWGTCSPDGALCFHWRAMLLPAARIEYLILHELVHLHECHHGPVFYQRLRQAAPDYEQHQDWLRRHGDRYAL